MQDSFKREVDYLRLSITDKCNLRCAYCMSPEFNDFLKKDQLITINDIENIMNVLTPLGITKVKITGGEPLLRQDFSQVLKLIKTNEKIEQVTLTTNGVLISKYINELEKYIDSINISLDTINKEHFEELTKRDELDKTLESIKLVVSKSLKNIKINTVPLKQYGNENIYELVEYCKINNLTIRFIEMMPIGLGKNYKSYSYAEVLEILETKYGKGIKQKSKFGNGPAIYYKFPKLNINVGFILAISNKFCSSCNKIRITSNGYLKPCLHYKDNLNIKQIAKSNTKKDIEELKDFIFTKPKEHKFLESLEEDSKNKNKENFEDKSMSFIGG